MSAVTFSSRMLANEVQYYLLFFSPSPLTSHEPARIWIRRCCVAARWKCIPSVNADKERGETQSRGMCDFKGALKGKHEFLFFLIHICVSDKHAKTTFDEVHLLADGKRRLTVNVVLLEKRINPNKQRWLTWIGSCIKWFSMNLELYHFNQ